MTTAAKPLLAALLATFLGAPVQSQSLDDVAQGALLTGWRTEAGAHMAALRITLAPGWKTYWRAPGEGGIPPRFDWSGSDNLTSVTTHYPVPQVFDQNGMRSVGYEGIVVFPLAFMPGDGARDITVAGDIEIGVCEDICIPMTLRIAAVLPQGAGRDNPEIRAALSDRPLTPSEAQVSEVACEITPISDGMRVSAEIAMPRLGRDETAVIELTDLPVWVSEPQVARRGGTLTATADLVPPEGAPFSLSRDSLRFTVLASGRAVEIRGCG